MATLVRRTWAQLRAEIITALGGYDFSGFSDRVEQYLYATYLELGTLVHHYELEIVSSPSVSTNDTTISVPSDCFVLMGVYRPSTATLGNMLELKSTVFLSQTFSATAAVPQFYARFKDKILLNCPVIVGAAGTWTLRYVAFPSAPDFATSTSPTTSWLWDDALIQGTVAKMMQRVWRPDLAAMGAQPLNEWIAKQAQESVRDTPLENLPEHPTASRPRGANQG